MPTLINAVNCTKYEQGTGLVPCEIFFGEPVGFYLVKRGWSIPVSTTFNKAYVSQRILDGTFVPFMFSKAFTENTPEPSRQEYDSTGQRRTNRNGLPDYMFEFNNGIGFHKAAYSYNASNYDLILFDGSGNHQLMSNVAQTEIMGIRLSDLNTRTYRQQSGTTAAATMMEMQIANAESFNRQMTLISRDQLDFNAAEEVGGIISINIEVVSASAGDGIDIIVTANNNKSYGVQGLTGLNLELHNITDDAVIAINTVAVSSTTIGGYTLTPATAPGVGDVIKIATKNYNLGFATGLAGGNIMQIYRGISPEKTTIA